MSAIETRLSSFSPSTPFFPDPSCLYKIPPARSRPLKVAIIEQQPDCGDIYDTPSSTPLATSTTVGDPLASTASSSSSETKPVPVSAALPVNGQILQPTHDSFGARRPTSQTSTTTTTTTDTIGNVAEDEAPTYDVVPAPSPAGSRAASSLGGSRTSSSICSAESVGERGGKHSRLIE